MEISIQDLVASIQTTFTAPDIITLIHPLDDVSCGSLAVMGDDDYQQPYFKLGNDTIQPGDYYIEDWLIDGSTAAHIQLSDKPGGDDAGHARFIYDLSFSKPNHLNARILIPNF